MTSVDTQNSYPGEGLSIVCAIRLCNHLDQFRKRTPILSTALSWQTLVASASCLTCVVSKTKSMSDSSSFRPWLLSNCNDCGCAGRPPGCHPFLHDLLNPAVEEWLTFEGGAMQEVSHPLWGGSAGAQEKCEVRWQRDPRGITSMGTCMHAHLRVMYT